MSNKYDEVLKNILVLFVSAMISYLFYYFISMDLINKFYSVNEQNGFILYVCHIIFFFILMKLIFSLNITKMDRVFATFMYICILYMALFDRFELTQSVINLNFLTLFHEANLTLYGLFQMILNILIFFPLYTILKWFLQLTDKQFFIIFIIMIFLIEGIQCISMRGMFDVIDLLLYGIGYGCGMKLYKRFIQSVTI